jgi:hypothetical protein
MNNDKALRAQMIAPPLIAGMRHRQSGEARRVSLVAAPRAVGRTPVPAFVERAFAMSFALISTVLGLAFAMVWAFVATMIIRLGQLESRREKDAR